MLLFEQNVLDIFTSSNQYQTPLYQRPYKWSVQDQCSQLWNSLLLLISDPNKEHFLGSIILHNTGSKLGLSYYNIIDGQQRLTSLLLIVIALKQYVIQKDLLEFNEAIDSLIFNKDFSEDDHYSLLLNGSDQQELKCLAESLFNQTSTDSLITTNAAYFLNQFHKLEKEIKPSKELVKQVLNSFSRLKLIIIIVEPQKGESPQVIFERINATGASLSDLDLIRNLLLQRRGTSYSADEIYDKYWRKMETLFPLAYRESLMSQLIQTYLKLKTGENVALTKLFTNFKNFFYKQQSEISNEDIAAELYQVAVIYSSYVLIGPKYHNADSDAPYIFMGESVSSALYEMSFFECSDFNVLVIKLIQLFQQNKLSEEELTKCLQLFISFMCRRKLVGHKLSLQRLSLILLEKIENCTDGDVFNALLKAFASENKKYHFPTDEEFIKALTSTPIYQKFSASFVAYFLFSLEGVNLKHHMGCNFSIEHIMPQNTNLNYKWQYALGPNWSSKHKKGLHVLGNLTMTVDNSVLSDREFEFKKDFFVNSKMHILNETVHNHDTWDLKAIESRGEFLAEIACKKWPYPNFGSAQ